MPVVRKILLSFSLTTYRYPGDHRPPLVERATVQEQKSPWRYGVGVMLRVPFTRFAVVFTPWTGKHDEEETEDGRYLSMRELNDWRQVVEDWDVVPEKAEN